MSRPRSESRARPSPSSSNRGPSAVDERIVAAYALRPDMARKDAAQTVHAYERGRAAWPTVDVSPEAFASHLQEVGAQDQHVEELFLAFACALGSTAAIALFEERYVREVSRYVARIDSSPPIVDEAKQLVRDYLLVKKNGERAHIADYTGRGPLGAWVRVIASRFVLQMKRKSARARDSDAEAAARLAALEPSPEVALVRARHGAELAAALKAAIAALAEKERGLIKLSVVDGLTVDELSGLYHVHRATVARWIARLKEQIFEAAVAQLRQQLLLDTAGVESLCRAVRSQLDFSLGGLLDG
jgi:RNA polymerase sigma-70 factor, ECF subfamily